MGFCLDQMEKDMSYCFLYPGQGAQKVGMADFLKGSEESIKLIYEADQILGFNLSKLIFEGPMDDLTLTENAQPALLAVGYAAHKYLVNIYELSPVAAAGHSLGEYTALVSSGVISYENGLRLVRERGKAMQEAVKEGQGGMVALLGSGNLDDLLEACKGDFCLVPANFNTQKQTVLSGDMQAIKRAVEAARDFGYLKAVELKVSAPFHSPLMKEAKERMKHFMKDVEFKSSAWPVASNFTGCMHEDNPSSIKDNLINQIEGAVRWVQNLKELSRFSFDSWVDVGPGKILFNMIPREDNRPKVNYLQFGMGKEG